jgi:hypothetical protein
MKAKLTARQRDEYDRAAQLYSDFSGHEAQALDTVRVNLPAVAIAIGRCDGILYTTVRDGAKEKYIHRFKAKAAPALACSPDGKQLYLIGGNYAFTERGIIDLE